MGTEEALPDGLSHILEAGPDFSILGKAAEISEGICGERGYVARGVDAKKREGEEGTGVCAGRGSVSRGDTSEEEVVATPA